MVSRTLLALSGVLASTSFVGATDDCASSSTVWVTTTTTCSDVETGKPVPTEIGGDSPPPSVTSPAQNGSDSYTVSAPSSVPTDAAGVVDHSFHSWACAVHWWPDYAGNNSDPNLFSRSIVKAIAEKVGSMPHIRVGGTSADRTYYIPDQEESILTTFGGNGIPRNVSIGPVFFEGFFNFPGSEYTFQVNLARNDSGAMANAVAEAQQAVNYIGANLESLEIGNEVDLYVKQSVRPAGYGTSDYVSEWLDHADAIREQVLVGNNASIDDTTIFQPLTYSTPFLLGDWSVSGAFDDGINDDNYVKSVSIHQYMTGRYPGISLQGSFMNHTQIVNNLTGFEPILSYLAESQPGIPLYLAEVNSDPINLNMDEYEGVFGSALWLSDYLLYAMTIGIPRVYIQQGTIFGFASWQPVAVNGTDPKIRAPFYGDLYIADTIGQTEDLQVVNIDLGSDTLSAYGLYGQGSLAKYAVLNLEEWNKTESGTRPQETVLLDVPQDVNSAKVTWLNAAGADSDSDITWAGQSWNYSASAVGELEITGSPQFDTITAEAGQLTLNINATQAALVELQYGYSS